MINYKGIDIKFNDEVRTCGYNYEVLGNKYETYNSKEEWNGEETLKGVKANIDKLLK